MYKCNFSSLGVGGRDKRKQIKRGFSDVPTLHAGAKSTYPNIGFITKNELAADVVPPPPMMASSVRTIAVLRAQTCSYQTINVVKSPHGFLELG